MLKLLVWLVFPTFLWLGHTIESFLASNLFGGYFDEPTVIPHDYSSISTEESTKEWVSDIEERMRAKGKPVQKLREMRNRFMNTAYCGPEVKEAIRRFLTPTSEEVAGGGNEDHQREQAYDETDGDGGRDEEGSPSRQTIFVGGTAPMSGKRIEIGVNPSRHNLSPGWAVKREDRPIPTTRKPTPPQL